MSKKQALSCQKLRILLHKTKILRSKTTIGFALHNALYSSARTFVRAYTNVCPGLYERLSSPMRTIVRCHTNRCPAYTERCRPHIRQCQSTRILTLPNISAPNNGQCQLLSNKELAPVGLYKKTSFTIFVLT